MCLKNRVNDENIAALNAIVTHLTTHGWEKASEVTFGESAAFDRLLLLSE